MKGVDLIASNLYSLFFPTLFHILSNLIPYIRHSSCTTYYSLIIHYKSSIDYLLTINDIHIALYWIFYTTTFEAEGDIRLWLTGCQSADTCHGRH